MERRLWQTYKVIEVLPTAEFCVLTVQNDETSLTRHFGAFCALIGIASAFPAGTQPQCLSLGLILGLQSRLIGLDKLAKLGSVGEQRAPLLQVEGYWESTQIISKQPPSQTL
jgi:hypothetical protein